MRQLTVREALREALFEEMRRDPTVVVFGEDIADPMGGSYKVTQGLSTEFGFRRVRNTPISEVGIVGAALAGLRPVAEIMYMDFLGIAMD